MLFFLSQCKVLVDLNAFHLKRFLMICFPLLVFFCVRPWNELTKEGEAEENWQCWPSPKRQEEEAEDPLTQAVSYEEN